MDEISNGISRVYGGVSAVTNFEITNLRYYDDNSLLCRGTNCYIVEFWVNIDRGVKMKNGRNVDVSLQEGLALLADDLNSLFNKKYKDFFINSQ